MTPGLLCREPRRRRYTGHSPQGLCGVAQTATGILKLLRLNPVVIHGNAGFPTRSIRSQTEVRQHCLGLYSVLTRVIRRVAYLPSGIIGIPLQLDQQSSPHKESSGREGFSGPPQSTQPEPLSDDDTDLRCCLLRPRLGWRRRNQAWRAWRPVYPAGPSCSP